MTQAEVTCMHRWLENRWAGREEELAKALPDNPSVAGRRRLKIKTKAEHRKKEDVQTRGWTNEEEKMQGNLGKAASKREVFLYWEHRWAEVL